MVATLPDSGFRQMFKDLAVLGGLYGMTRVGLAIRGIHVTPPWPFLSSILLFALPTAYLLTHGITWLERRADTFTPWRQAGGIVLGVVLLSVYHFVFSILPLLLVAFLVAILANFRRGKLDIKRPLLVGGPILFLGYATVWELNYLLASATFDRINDPGLLKLDLILYGWLLNTSSDPVGMFPVVRFPVVLRILENSYHILFVEIFVVFFVLIEKRRSIHRFLRTFFLCYFLGLAVFYVFPAVGPCIFLPETFDPLYRNTPTGAIMQGMHGEYQALKRGEPLSGFGYFVAVPSLHVAQAILLQAFLWASRMHFWVFLPINTLMILSTFLLGYHYLVDIPAGMLLALVVLLGKHYLSGRGIEKGTEVGIEKGRQVALVVPDQC